MFGSRYFGRRFWGGRFWGAGSGAGTSGGSGSRVYWGRAHWGGRYWGARYFPGGANTPPVVTLRFRAALVASLLADSGVAGVVGAKVYPGRVPEKTVLPAIVWQVVSMPRDHHLGGPAGVARARVQFTAAGKTAAACEAAAEALRQKLDGYSGTLPGGVVVFETCLEDERDMSDPPDDGSDYGIFRTAQDYTFYFRESAPAR